MYIRKKIRIYGIYRYRSKWFLIQWVIEQFGVINETLFKKISRDMMKLNLLFIRKISFGT